MKTRLFFILFLSGLFLVNGETKSPRTTEKDSFVAAQKLMQAATNSDFAFERLALLCDKFGPRFSGSTNLEAAIDWTIAEMKRDGLENVHGEEVSVPHWVRGHESAELISPRPHKINMLGLGGSVGTPPEGITAEVLVVSSFEDLTKHAAEARGKIVLFNQKFTEYHDTVLIRSRGAMRAAEVGAVASLIRSIAPFSMNSPHTGNMRYTNSLPEIPHAAITLEDSEMLQRMHNRGEKIVVCLKMEAKTLPNAISRNVIGEIVGSEKPDEIVLISGHIDSWDVGQGAMDDGGGCLTAWESVRLMHKLGMRPRRTIRVVLWTNEENGIAGGKAYRDAHKVELNKHVLAIECDDGVFKPRGFAFNGSDKARAQMKKISGLFKSFGAAKIFANAGGADISQLEPAGVPIADLWVDPTKYFWYHHTEADTMDKLDIKDFNLCVAAMAGMSFSVADFPEALPRK